MYIKIKATVALNLSKMFIQGKFHYLLLTGSIKERGGKRNIRYGTITDLQQHCAKTTFLVIRNPWSLVNDLMRISLQLTTNQSQVGEGVEDMKREQVSDAFNFKLCKVHPIGIPPCMITLMIFRIMYLLIMSTVPQGI